MRAASKHALRLPASLKKEAEEVARRDGATLNQFIVTAVAEKLSAQRTAAYFAARAKRGDLKAFDEMMARPGGSPAPREDHLPEDGDGA